MLRLRSNHSITYFAQFLTEIGLIINNIKQYVYQIIDIPLPKSKLQNVCQSMSSVVVFTHKTFDDLKKIESMISGYAKARRVKKDEVSLNSTNSTTFRSKSSQSSQIFHSIKNNKNQLFSDEFLSTGDSKNINEDSLFQKFRSSNSKQNAKKEELVKRKLYYKSHTIQAKVQSIDQQQKINKQNLQNSKFSSNQKLLQYWRTNIDQKICKIIQLNRQNMTKIIHKNQQCSDLIKQVKQQIIKTL